MRPRHQLNSSVPADSDDADDADEADDALAKMSEVLWARLSLALSIVALCALVAFIGCGANDLVVGGMVPSPTESPVGTPGCLPTGSDCGLSSDCCSGSCVSPDGISLICQ